VSTLSDPTWHACLVRRGYEPRGFENVLGHSLVPDANPALERARTESHSIERATADDLTSLADVMVEAFGAPDAGGVGGDAIPPGDELRRWFTLTMTVPGFEGILVRVGGVIAAGGFLRFDGDVAQFCGAATLPDFRRRGLQSALLHWRLAHARAAGCHVAVVTTQPASKSQENAQRAGFHLLYARELLVKA
jgi:GNAT superfamily N-acetyltransferase